MITKMSTNDNHLMQETAHGTDTMSAPCAVSVGGDGVQPLPVASTLRKLAIGQSAVFPIEQRSTVLNTISRFRSDYSRTGWDATTETNKKQFSVIVTRVR